MSTANRVIKNTGFLYAKMGITMFISLYTTRLILNALGASDFGIFNIVGGAIAMLGFLNTAMASATQRFMSYSEGEGDKEKQKKIFNISFILHTGIAILMGLVLIIAGWFFFNGILNIAPDRIYAAKIVYASLIVSSIFTILTVPYDAILNAHENMLYYSIVGIIESLLKLAVAVAVIYYSDGDRLILYGVLMAVIPLITMTIMLAYSHNHYNECTLAPKRYWDKELMTEMTGFAGWSFFSSMTSMLGNYGLGIVLNMFFGTVVNAAQAIANQTSGQLMAFSTTMQKALNPIIAKSEGASNRILMMKASFTGSKLSFYLLAFFAIPIFIEMPFVLKIWLKDVPDNTIIFTRLQLGRTLIEQLTIVLPYTIAAQGNIKNYSIARTVLNIIPLPVIYILFKLNFPPYSMYVICIFFWGIIVNLINLYYTKKVCCLSIKNYTNEVIMPCLTIISTIYIIGLIPHFLITDNLFRLTTVTITCFLIFPFAAFYLGLNLAEKNQVIRLLKKLNLHK